MNTSPAPQEPTPQEPTAAGTPQDNRAHKLATARALLALLDFPRAQLNDRSALTLLALLDLKPDTPWANAQSPLLGITPIMDWCRDHYQVAYAPNTRETFRRQTMHQFMAAVLAVANPDRPDRPVNSPKWCYQIEPHALALLRTVESAAWPSHLATYLDARPGLRQHYAKQRELTRIPVTVAPGVEITLSPGKHSALIQAILDQFAPRFAPGCAVLYVGDTGEKWGYADHNTLSSLGVTVDTHGKMPDVILYLPAKNWLYLIESVTSHGPVDGKRHDELTTLFAAARVGIIYVTAFPTRADMARYLTDISWETEVWVADAPDHLIHFNGPRFLGPYS